jgi:hypothetical protein
MNQSVKRFFESIQDYSLGGNIYSFADGVDISLRPSRAGDAVYVMKIRSRMRGQGLASASLESVCSVADECKIDLFLEVEESDGLDSNQLAEWYWRHGFRGNLQEMIRRHSSAE